MTQWRGIPSVPPTDATSQIFLQSIKENLENVIVLLDPTKYGKAQNTAYLNNDITNLQFSITGVSASVTNETNARVAADDALAEQIQQLIVSGSSAVMTYAQTTAPTSPNLGDIWFDTDDDNKVHRYSGSAWVPVDDLRTIANTAAISNEQTVRLNADNALASDITSLTSLVNTSDATLQANINSEATTRANADTALATRATTLEATVNSATDGNLALKSRIATEETARADGDAANASAITSLTATVGTKNRTFAQSTAPTATAIGDLWLNTADSSKTYRWNGSSWVLAADTRIAAVVTESSANATAIGDINAQYSVTVAAGKVTGFKLISSPTTSSFIVSADYFAVENASGRPFEVVGGNVYLQGNLIQAGSIGITKFASGLQPVEIVNTLPTTGNYKGRVAFLNTDSKLYRHDGTNWSTAVASTDISGTIADAQIAAVGATKVTGQLSDAQIATLSAAKVTGQITGTQITDGAISTAKLAAGSVTSNEIAANTITAADIASGTITATEIAAATITGAKIAAGTILAGNIAANTITASQIAANTITASQIAANTITGDRIVAGTIAAAQLATTQLLTVSAQIGDGLITNAKIGNLEVDSAKIANLTVGTTKITPHAVTIPVTYSGFDQYIYNGGGAITVLEMPDYLSVGDASDGGVMAVYYATFDGRYSLDAGQLITFYVDYNDGSGYNFLATQIVGTPTNNGQTYSCIPIALAQSISAVQYVKFKVTVQVYNLGTGGTTNPSYHTGIKLSVLGAKR